MSRKKNQLAERANDGHITGNIRAWFPVVGAILGGLTLVFFMAVVIISMLGTGIPTSSRFVVVIVLALGAGLSASFLGGSAVAQGSLPIPFMQNKPVAFSVTSGVAVVVIVLILGYVMYVR